MGAVSGSSGYIIPTLDWDGRITGGQLRLRGQNIDNRYLWFTEGLHLANGEMPLQILKGDSSLPVYWIEGTGVKPWMVHLATGATVIGAAGGNFSPVRPKCGKSTSAPLTKPTCCCLMQGRSTTPCDGQLREASSWCQSCRSVGGASSTTGRTTPMKIPHGSTELIFRSQSC